ncbi:FAD-dependent oxidoreductase [Streptosporangium sp. NPDC002721]|uniref:FAD-dependent oxidoreductase n=1 Tax=Streptosporangium sp. NPDC002721 TaxID=3366188 RepID=UPI0036BF4669
MISHLPGSPDPLDGPAHPALEDRAAVVGAGPAGSLLAILLARRGHPVDVYDMRPDPRDGKGDGEGRSINLGLSARGIRALRHVGLWNALGDRLVPMRGRMIHRPGRPAAFQAYGTDPREILYSVDRDELTTLLVESAAGHEGVRHLFGVRCAGVDRESGTLTLADTITGETREARADFVVGADGAFSAVRAAMQRGLTADYRQEFLEWGYKELTIPAAPGGGSRVPLEALHVWPGENALIVAHPNVDGSLTATLFLPHSGVPGAPGFAELAGERDVTDFFLRVFPGVLDLVPDLAAQYAANPVGNLVTIRTSRWRHGDRVVLAGDAAHAVYPFYGQGMNSSLEDCLVLDGCLARHPRDRAAAFEEYQRLRKPHTDILADLSERNFADLRDGTRSPLSLARRQADLALNRAFPDLWKPLYTMVSHTDMPYGEALRRARRQDRVLRWSGAALAAGAVGAALAAVRIGTSPRRTAP